MNSLSWFVYLAGVVNGVSTLFLFMCVVLLIGAAIGTVVYWAECSDTIVKFDKWEFESADSSTKVDSAIRFLLGVRTFRNACLAMGISFGLLSILVPDRQTVIMIGASEFGQRVIEAETTQRLLDPSVSYIENWLRQEIEKMRGESQPANPPRQGR